MRILIVTGIFPPDAGGPATYVPRMAAALAERGHQVTVVTLSDRVDHGAEGYPFRLVRLPRQVFRPWRWLCTVATLIRLGRHADVLFVNGLAMEAVLANALLGKPLVHKVVGDLAWERAINHGWVTDGFEEFQQRRHGLKVEALKALRTWWTRRAGRVIVPSRYLARAVAGWGVPEGKITVVYNAVERFEGIEAAELPLKTRMGVITVGRFVPWKHVDGAIEAVTGFEDVGLVLVGDGPEQGFLEALVRELDAEERVIFTGRLKLREVRRFMAACDVFVLNSTYEGLPHVALEAMSEGLPVVATAVGGTPEVVRDGVNGVLIPPGDREALRAAIARLLDPEERCRLAAGARDTAGRFTFERMVEKTETVLVQSAGGEG